MPNSAVRVEETILTLWEEGDQLRLQESGSQPLTTRPTFSESAAGSFGGSPHLSLALPPCRTIVPVIFTSATIDASSPASFGLPFPISKDQDQLECVFYAFDHC